MQRRIRFLVRSGWCLVWAAVLGCLPALAYCDSWVVPERAPAPADNIPNATRVELGRLLFFDPRLSAKSNMSCASCHNPALGWADGLPRAFGYDMKPLDRATPTIVNAALNGIQMWDGRKPTLEDQALGPLLSAGEQNLTAEQLEDRIRSIKGYLPLFERAYPGEGVTTTAIAKAIASFERTILSTDSPFDRWQRGDQRAVSDSVKRGFAVFTGKARCGLCHQGSNFSDDGFHNIGLKNNGEPDDLGRYGQRKVAVLKGAFKTPTLRDIELTAPYMHNGLYRTLEEVIDHYDRGGDVTENLDRNIQPLELTAGEKADLLAFLKSLTGSTPQVLLAELPR
jgi:cytochrome c peroxidase